MVEIIDLTDLTDSSDQPEDDLNEEYDSDSEHSNSSSSSSSSSSSHSSSENDSDSDSEDVPAVSNVQLAIATVPEDRLRAVVARLVARIPAVEHALVQELAAGHGTGTGTGTSTSTGIVTTSTGTEDRTRQAVTRRPVTCTRCGEAFDANEERDEDECAFHPGKLRVDEASFVDWDEDCHGPMDTRSNRRDYPENFLWTCCREDGTSGGCVTGRHTEVGGGVKRMRV